MTLTEELIAYGFVKITLPSPMSVIYLYKRLHFKSDVGYVFIIFPTNRSISKTQSWSVRRSDYYIQGSYSDVEAYLSDDLRAIMIYHLDEL